jgi:hypothetical protein
MAAKIGWKCHGCGETLKRKSTEPKPTECSYCHTFHPLFTQVVVK